MTGGTTHQMTLRRLAARATSCKLGCLFGALILVAGCGGSSSFNSGSTTGTASGGLKGKLLGGQYPVTGAEVQLYAAGTTGSYGTGAQALLSPAVTTDNNGDFTISPTQYKCPSDTTPTYLVATGGDPGLGSNNPAIALMAAVGPCGDLSSSTFVSIDEVTTVASVWALAPFLGAGAQVGTSPTNVLGLANAFANVNNLVNVSNGIAPGTVPTRAVIPVSKINSLANILAACVNSSGTAMCDTLFAAATPAGGSAPTNTLDAALNIARNPSASVGSLFAIPTANSPFQPSLSTQPPDWLIGATYVGGGLDYPASIAVDALGNVWAANVCGSDNPCSSVTELSSTGQPLSPAGGFTDGTFWESFGIAIDVSANVWVTNEQTTSANSGLGNVVLLNSSGSVISPAGGYFGGGLDFPFAVAIDTDGNVWTANLGDSSATKFSNSGSVSAISGSGGFGTGDLAGPVAVAIGASNNAWFADQSANSGSVTSISSGGTPVSNFASGGDETSGIATDSISTSGTISGHIWTANYSSSTVSELELGSNGDVTVVPQGYAGGGLNHPNGIAVDGAGNVWVTNYDSATRTSGATITELQGANGASPGSAISSTSGFGEDAGLLRPYGIAVDASGNVWVSNFGSSTITQFLGAATPVKTPLIGPPQLP